MKLPELSIRRPVFVTVIFLVVTLLGAVSFFRLPVDLMPDISFPSLTIRTNYQGVGPQEIEELISIPIERAMASTPGVKEITSNSSEGSSQVRVSFEWGTDLEAAADEVRTRMDRIRGQMPLDASPSTIFKFDVSTFPIMFLGVSGQMNPRDLREFAERQIQYRLERVPGVAQADIWGGLQREIHVVLDRFRMDALRITPSQVTAALRRENINEPAGQVTEGEYEVLVRTRGEYASLEQIAHTLVARREGRPIYIRDIARVDDSHREVRNLVRIDGVPGLRMSIRKQSGANTVDVARRVKEEIDRINSDFAHVQMFVISDSSRFIETAVRNVRDAALYGSFLAVFVLLLFLRNLRSTLIIGISIPISVIASFGLMYFYGFTLNTITFGGLALGVGMLVDNAIVVLENIFRHREEGTEKKEAARKGTSEVALAITASTLTTVVVFLPVVFMTGMSGIMFQQLAWVVSFSLFSSLLVSLTLIPLMASRMVKVREPKPTSLSYGVVHGTGRLLAAVDETYLRALNWSLRHRYVIVSSTATVFLGAYLLIPFIGVELQPETDEGEVRVSLDLPAGSRLEVTDAMAREAERIIRDKVPEVQTVLAEIGSAGGWQSANTHNASLRITLVPRDQRNRSSHQIAMDLRPEFAGFPGVITRLRASGGNFVARLGQQGDGDRLALDIRGYEMAATYDLAVEIRQLMESTEGVSDAVVSRSIGRPETRINIDRIKAASMGVAVSDLAANVRTSIGGTTATYFRQGGEEYGIVVRYEEENRRRIEDVLSIPIQTPAGPVVPLGSLVSLEREEGPVEIQRKDQQRTIAVYGNLSGSRDMGAVVADLQEKIQGLNISPDFAIVFSGEWRDQQEAFYLLQLAMILALILVYLVMAAQFESFRFPLLILFSVPLALIGVVLMLFLTKTTFNMQAFIGAIMLVGIVVNNAIVLVDCILQLQRQVGLGLIDSLIAGGRRRVRPILMTTLTTVLGLTPMAMGIGEGGELQAPMGRVLIGGLLSSTFITLFFIPTLYLTVARFSLRRRVEIPAGAEALGPASQ